MQGSLSFGTKRIEIPGLGGQAILHLEAVAASEELFATLRSNLAWTQQDIRLFGEYVPQPRLTAWYGEEGLNYSYSGIELRPLPWTTELAGLRDLCEALSAARFNSVLANLYRTGADSVSWHADNEPELGQNPVIASVSLGGERRFDLRNRATGETVKTMLPSGSVLVMSGTIQHDWVHQVPKTKKPVNPRINLTFRRILV